MLSETIRVGNKGAGVMGKHNKGKLAPSMLSIASKYLSWPLISQQALHSSAPKVLSAYSIGLDFIKYNSRLKALKILRRGEWDGQFWRWQKACTREDHGERKGWKEGLEQESKKKKRVDEALSDRDWGVKGHVPSFVCQKKDLRYCYASPYFSLERETGFEPATFSLGSWHSTAELFPLLLLGIYTARRYERQELRDILPCFYDIISLICSMDHGPDWS